MEIKKKAVPAGTVERAPQGTLTNRFYPPIEFTFKRIYKLFLIKKMKNDTFI